MTTTTTRFGILRPVTTDPAAGAPTTGLTKYLTSPTDRLESVGAMYSQGTLASRPSAATAGRFYVATDGNAVFYDTGSAWLLVGWTTRSASLGPFNLATGGWTVASSAISSLALPVAGTYRYTISADFSLNSGSTSYFGGLDLKVANGGTTYRSAGSGDQMQTLATSIIDAATVSKQIVVTVPGSAATDLYGFARGPVSASNVKIIVEPIAL